LLERGHELAPQVVSNVGRIATTAHRMGRLIEDLLDSQPQV
jgi:hypothetical protein